MAYGKSQITDPEIERLEIQPPTDEQAELLAYTSSQLKRVANLCVRLWIAYHECAGTLVKLNAGEPCGAPVPPELAASFLRESQKLCPDVSVSTILAVTNWLAQTIKTQKSPRSNVKRCWQVLRYAESHWCFTFDLPIRLWTGNSKIVRHAGGIAVAVRLDRHMVEGKKLAESTLLTLPLVRPKTSKATAGHRAAYLAACEIADGKRHYAQSQLVCERGKWFVMLTVSGAPPMDAAHRSKERVLVVRPGRGDALRVRGMDGLRGGFGDFALDRIAKCRAALDRRRQSVRKDLGSVPDSVADNLSRKWRNHSTTICHQLAVQLTKALANNDYGRVLWLDGNNRTAALALAGRNGDRDRRELFPFERLRLAAERKLEKLGVEVVTRANFRSVKRRKSDHAKRTKCERSTKTASKSARQSKALANDACAPSGATT